eukprot:s7_g7.t1
MGLSGPDVRVVLQFGCSVWPLIANVAMWCSRSVRRIAGTTAEAAVRGSRPSLLAAEILRCADGAQVLRVGAATQLPFCEADLQCFLGRLKELRKMPISGGDLRAFLKKVEEALPMLSPETAHLALTIFAELRCRQGAVFAWPLLLENRSMLPPSKLAEAVWAASAVPSPPKDLLYQAVGLARELTPQLPQLPDEALYRCVYGLARIHSGRGSALYLRSAQRCAVTLLQRRPLQLMPRQLVRFCWSLARLGCRENVVYDAFENCLREVLDKLQYKDLEALYSILTELERVEVDPRRGARYGLTRGGRKCQASAEEALPAAMDSGGFDAHRAGTVRQQPAARDLCGDSVTPPTRRALRIASKMVRSSLLPAALCCVAVVTLLRSTCFVQAPARTLETQQLRALETATLSTGLSMAGGDEHQDVTHENVTGALPAFATWGEGSEPGQNIDPDSTEYYNRKVLNATAICLTFAVFLFGLVVSQAWGPEVGREQVVELSDALKLTNRLIRRPG